MEPLIHLALNELDLMQIVHSDRRREEAAHERKFPPDLDGMINRGARLPEEERGADGAEMIKRRAELDNHLQDVGAPADVVEDGDCQLANFA